jgi:NADPH2:quinone reductase
VGEGVDADWLGRLVVAHTGGQDGYADLALAELESCAAIPDGVDLLDATAVLHDGTTALRILEVTGPEAGEWVLVLGAAGGMGILLVQLLVRRGVRVVGAVRGRIKQEIVSAAGAEVVDYSQPTWTQDVLSITDGIRPPVVLDGVGGSLGADAYGIISDGGRFSAHGTPSGSFAHIDGDSARRRGITLTTIGDLQYRDEERARLLGAVLGALSLGHLAPMVGQTFALEDAEKAHLQIEERETVAKTLLVSS